MKPSRLYRSDDKRPDGASVVSWRCGKSLVWDATFVDTLAPSHQTLAAREPRAVAVDGESKKHSKYAHPESTHHFVPVAVETLGALGPEASSLLKEIAAASLWHVVRRELTSSSCNEWQWRYRGEMRRRYLGLYELFVCFCLFVCFWNIYNK